MKMSVSWAVRRRVLLAPFGALALTAGLVPGSPAVAEDQDADVSLRYACESAPGQQVTVRIRNTFPATGTAGKPVRPGKATVAVTVPAAALGDLADATGVTGTVNLGMLVSPPPPTSVDWTGLAVAQAPVRQGDRLTFTASGSVPSVPASAAGPMVFSAAQLTLGLKPGKTDGSATPPAPVSLTCTPGLGQNSTVATVFVSGDEQRPERSAPQPRSAGPLALEEGEENYCPEPPGTQPDLRYLPKDEPPEGTPGYEARWQEPREGCAKAYGYSNVKKSDGATRVTATAYVYVAQRLATYAPANFFSQMGSGMMYPDPLDANFLTYGFMPTSAKVDVIPLEPITIAVEGPMIPGMDPPRKNQTNLYTKVILRVRDVRVNGVPLEVGDNCRSARPIDLTLNGRLDTEPRYDVDEGGLLQGHIDIPPFTGCGVGEDLDNVFTSSISGPGNYIRMLQGPLCAATPGGGIHPHDNAKWPCPMQRYGWKIEPGGDITATASELRLTNDRGMSITCTSAAMNGSLPEFTPKAETEIRMSSFTISGCTGAPPLDTPFDITTSSNRIMSFMTYDQVRDRTRGKLYSFNPSIRVGSCTIRFATSTAVSFGFEYNNATHTFEFKPGVLVNDLGMRISGISGNCGTDYQTGDVFTATGNFVVDGPLTIRRP